MAPTPKTKTTNGRKTRTVKAPATVSSPRLNRENERLLKKNERLIEELEGFKNANIALTDRNRRLLSDIDKVAAERDSEIELKKKVAGDGMKFSQDYHDAKRSIGILKDEIERLRTERDTYRGALAACNPETERHISERLGGVVVAPETQTIPMVSRQLDSDFAEVRETRWHEM